MPPFLPGLVRRNSVLQPSEASYEVSEQWAHPGDVFSVLLILGGDIVARALAQLSGRKIGLPSFSFGKTTTLDIHRYHRTDDMEWQDGLPIPRLLSSQLLARTD